MISFLYEFLELRKCFLIVALPERLIKMGLKFINFIVLPCIQCATYKKPLVRVSATIILPLYLLRCLARGYDGCTTSLCDRAQYSCGVFRMAFVKNPPPPPHPESPLSCAHTHTLAGKSLVIPDILPGFPANIASAIGRTCSFPL